MEHGIGSLQRRLPKMHVFCFVQLMDVNILTIISYNSFKLSLITIMRVFLLTQWTWYFFGKIESNRILLLNMRVNFLTQEHLNEMMKAFSSLIKSFGSESIIENAKM